jgi:arylsulfatase A-like enzyme
MEGGLRVPFILRWPGRLEAGTEVTSPVSTLDIFPTVAGAVGGKVSASPLDGIDLIASIRKDEVKDRSLFWRVLPVRAVLQDGKKLVHAYDVEEQRARYWMYDVVTDPGETQDQYVSRPELASELLDDLDARAQLDYVAPSWPPRESVADYYGESMIIGF